MTAATGSLSVPAWRRLATRMHIDIRPGEARMAFLLFVFFLLLVTFQYATKSVRQSSFIDTLGAANLPWMYLAVAITSYPLLRLYGWLAGYQAGGRMIAASCAVIGASMVAFWWLLQFDYSWIPAVLYVWFSIIYALNYSQFWSLSGRVLSARQAKRLFGFIGAGGLLGGVAGGQLARAMSQVADTRATLLVAAALMGLVAFLSTLVPRQRVVGTERTRDAGDKSKTESAQGGFEIIRASRQLQLIAALMVVTILVAQIVDLQFNWAVEQSTTGLDQRTAFFGNFYSVMNLAAFIFQLIFTARIHRTLGVGAALRALPLTMGLGTIALLAAGPVFPALLLAAAMVLKIGETGLRYSLDQSTRELLYLPIPARLRGKAKAYVDVFFHRGAKGLAALLLLPVSFGLITVVQAGWLTLVLVVGWLVLATAATREYVRAFRDSLRRRTVDHQVPINIEDSATLEILVQSLGSLDPRQVLHGLEILAAHDRANLVPPLLLYHDDPEVRLSTLKLLAKAGRRDAAPLVERRLSDENPEVQAEAMRVLAELQGQDVCELMLPHLSEGEPAVRAAAVACLTTHGSDKMGQLASHVLEELLSDEDPRARAEAAKAIGSMAEPKFSARLVKLLYDPDPRVLRQAIAAVHRRVGRDGPNPLFTPTLISLLQNRRVKHEARGALVAMGEDIIPALVHFLGDPDESLWVRRALPKTIARIGGRKAATSLLDALDSSTDDFLRRKLIEALLSFPAGQVRAVENGRIRLQIRREARGYAEKLLGLFALTPATQMNLAGPLVVWDEDLWEPHLLDRLLAEQMDDHVRNLFSLLALLYPPGRIRDAYRGVVSGNTLLRGHALEYLDNTLSPDLRSEVLAVSDDTPVSEKLARACKRFGLPRRSKVETLRDALLCGDLAGETSRALCLASLYKVHTDRVETLFDQVDRLRSEEVQPLVRETADWISRRRRNTRG